jgi:hypothetical protein
VDPHGRPRGLVGSHFLPCDDECFDHIYPQ